MAKAPIYRQDGFLPNQKLFEDLRAACEALEPHAPKELFDALQAAVLDVEEASRATKHIVKGGTSVGFGVSKADKAIACDNVVSIVRQIKALKSW